jgi:hypothetical protein
LLFRSADGQLWLQFADVHHSVQQPHPHFFASHHRDGPVHAGTKNVTIRQFLCSFVDELFVFEKATFINNDLEMYHVETDTPACARTSNLNEELGQVKYVFSDKTGTLTQNVMEFQQCSVGGTIYSAKSDVVVNSSGMASSMVQDLTAKHSNAPYIREFLTLLAVCHTVIPEKDETNPEILHYHAASPGLVID